MRHENSVFHGLTKHIPWTVFDRLVEQHDADYRVRKLTTKNQFMALLFSQLAGADSLRSIEAGLASHQSRLYHLGAKPVARSTLSDANAARPWQVFGELFAHMAGTADRATRRRIADVTHILDATKIKLPASKAAWARFSKNQTAAKLHLVYDPNADIPLSADVTPDNVNDITPAKELDLVPGATYVFDLAYYDYGWWAKLDDLGCRFVTRLKKNTRLSNVIRQTPPEAGNILSDHIGHLPQRQARSRKNPMADPVREITVRNSTGKIIRLVTNDLDAPAEEIAELYKQRWQIELFFKWIKQNLKIKHLIGTSENAVKIQAFVALIAYLIMRIAYAAQNAVKRPVTFARLIRLNIMIRRALSEISEPEKPRQIDVRQTELDFATC